MENFNDSKALAIEIAKILDKKKAHDVRVLKVESLTVLTDYFVIASGTSTTQVAALADEVEFELSQKGLEPYSTEGYDSKNWVLLDYSNVIVHVFVPNTRTYYDLEHLWADGEPIDISDAVGERFVCMTEGHSVRTIQDRLFERCNFKPNVILETDNMEAAKHVAARANAVMLIPHVYVVNSMELKYRVQCHPIKNNDYERHFFFCYRKGMYLTRYMEDFGRIVCDKLNVPFNMPGHEA